MEIFLFYSDIMNKKLLIAMVGNNPNPQPQQKCLRNPKIQPQEEIFCKSLINLISTSSSVNETLNLNSKVNSRRNIISKKKNEIKPERKRGSRNAKRTRKEQEFLHRKLLEKIRSVTEKAMERISEMVQVERDRIRSDQIRSDLTTTKIYYCYSVGKKK